MKEKIEQIKDNISHCGEMLSNNVNNDFAFTYGEIYDVMMRTLEEMGIKAEPTNEATNDINLFFDRVIDKFNNGNSDVEKKNIAFNHEESKAINELLYESFGEMDEIIKWVEDKESAKKEDDVK